MNLYLVQLDSAAEDILWAHPCYFSLAWMELEGLTVYVKIKGPLLNVTVKRELPG